MNNVPLNTSFADYLYQQVSFIERENERLKLIIARYELHRRLDNKFPSLLFNSQIQTINDNSQIGSLRLWSENAYEFTFSVGSNEQCSETIRNLKTGRIISFQDLPDMWQAVFYFLLREGVGKFDFYKKGFNCE